MIPVAAGAEAEVICSTFTGVVYLAKANIFIKLTLRTFAKDKPCARGMFIL